MKGRDNPGQCPGCREAGRRAKGDRARGLADRLDEGDPVPKGLALEGQPSLRLLQKARGSAQFGQGVGGSEQPVLIELDHDVSLLDDVARGKRGHPVVRQVPADKVEIPRVEGADVVPDVAGARGVADEVDLALGVIVPDGPGKRIVIAAPDKALRQVAGQSARRPERGSLSSEVPSLYGISP